MRISGRITDAGQVEVHGLASPFVAAWCEKRKGQRIEVELRDEAAIRSNRQNRFLHGPVLDELARVWHADGWRDASTEPPQPMPRWMVRERALHVFCPRSFALDPAGAEHYARRSTADLTVAEFKAMLDDIAEYLVHKEGETGIMPDPEDWHD